MFSGKVPLVKRMALPLAGLLVLTVIGQALGHGGSHAPSPSPSRSDYRDSDRSKPKPTPVEPYNGQKICPVTRDVLGLHGPAVPVETIELPSTRPGFFGKLFGRKPKKAVIYVCCSDCAAKVKQDPWHYQMKVIAARSGWKDAEPVSTAGANSR